MPHFLALAACSMATICPFICASSAANGKREYASSIGLPPWRRSADRARLHANSPANREFYREFCDFGLSEANFVAKTPRCLTSAQMLGSRRLQPLRAAHLPPLQLNNTSRAGGTLLGLGQWKGEKEGRSFGGARRMNAAA